MGHCIWRVSSFFLSFFFIGIVITLTNFFHCIIGFSFKYVASGMIIKFIYVNRGSNSFISYTTSYGVFQGDYLFIIPQDSYELR